ncbi:response regulator [Segetibacter koreensis]|uniref:response regulator n=1 Tax=Segetibacter koreensis TaxID=398037 RepID=UPI00036E3131|nr:response regulator [Segetibacter koreensis]
MNTQPILIIDDDLDDKEFIQEVWKELPYLNELMFFTHPQDVLILLKDEQIIPFLIISDINLPTMSGFEFKRKLLGDTALNYKSIPFVFFSGVASNEQIQKSYELGSNGFFVKNGSIAELKETFITIVEYWQKSKVPQLRKVE